MRQNIAPFLMLLEIVPMLVDRNVQKTIHVHHVAYRKEKNLEIDGKDVDHVQSVMGGNVDLLRVEDHIA